jgi:hypothetical protein
MPALFAYLIAVGLLLGGGYSALNWLAAPEPVKVVAKAKPKPLPRDEVKSEPGSSEPSSLAINDSDRATSGSNERTPVPPTGSSAAAREQGVQAAIPGPAQDDQKNRSANAELAPADVKQTAQIVPQQVVPQAATTGTQQTTASIAPVAKTAKRRPLQQASGRSEKPALTLMTLRTIEFPDGRRVTRLIPYRGGERALAFERAE